jgi:hypothetical protein
MSKDLKRLVSEILVRWEMPTRQPAINEIVALLEAKSKYCEKAACIRKVYVPHLYCEQHEDKNSTLGK